MSNWMSLLPASSWRPVSSTAPLLGHCNVSPWVSSSILPAPFYSFYSSSLSTFSRPVFSARHRLSHKSWLLFAVLMLLISIINGMGFGGLPHMIEWCFLILHVAGPEDMGRPFNRQWAKDILATKMIGSYGIFLIKCPILSSPILVVGLLAVTQFVWFFFITHGGTEVSIQETALIPRPPSALMELASPIHGFCQAESLATYVVQTFVGLLIVLLYQ